MYTFDVLLRFIAKSGAQFYPNKTLEKRRSLAKYCDLGRMGPVPLPFVASESGFWKDKIAPLTYLKKGNYNKCALKSSAEILHKYAGGISKIVLQPFIPSDFMRTAALAHATITEAVNSGLESSFKLYSMI